MIWDIIFITKTGNKMTDKILNSLLTLFCIHYSSGCKKRRRYIIYFAISILIDNYNSNIEIIHNKATIEQVIGQIGNIYKQVKKNEIAPKTDYLFNEEMKAKSNLDKTIEKLDKLNEIVI